MEFVAGTVMQSRIHRVGRLRVVPLEELREPDRRDAVHRRQMLDYELLAALGH